MVCSSLKHFFIWVIIQHSLPKHNHSLQSHTGEGSFCEFLSPQTLLAGCFCVGVVGIPCICFPKHFWLSWKIMSMCTFCTYYLLYTAALTRLKPVWNDKEYFSQFQDTTDELPCHIHLPVCLWIVVPHSWAAKKNTSHENEVLPQNIMHLIQRPCYQQGSLC